MYLGKALKRCGQERKGPCHPKFFNFFYRKALENVHCFCVKNSGLGIAMFRSFEYYHEQDHEWL